MHILLTGGGSGGHVTPLLAVAHELKQLHPDCKLSYIGEKGGNFGTLVEDSGLFEEVHYVHAGKFRRYHDENIVKRILDVRTNALNIRDIFYTALGCVQAWKLLGNFRPNVVFIKGGFVGVPVGVAARLRNVPFMTHDSDVVPGLANRLIGRWAAHHATGMPVEFYNYPIDKTSYVGVPISTECKPATASRISTARTHLGVPEKAKMLFVTGGSQGSERINGAVKSVANRLLGADNNLHIYHHVGKGNEKLYGKFSHDRLHISPFYNNFVQVATAADVILTRAGANSMAEFAALAKATIVIPSPFLANGHQLKNAQKLAENDAIVELQENKITKNPELLAYEINQLLDDPKRRMALAKNLHQLAKPHAARDIAELIISIAEENQ